MRGLEPRRDGGWDVTTTSGTLAARRVVNCSGFWGREVGRLAGQDLPLVAVQHQYLVTKSVPEVQALKREFPVLRHLGKPARPVWGSLHFTALTKFSQIS